MAEAISIQQLKDASLDAKSLSEFVFKPDSLHPNTAGHIWYANRVEDFILRLAK